VVTAITSHVVSVALYTQPTYVTLLITVVVGIVTPTARNMPFQFNVRAVPLSLNLKINLLPVAGVPVGALIANVSASAVKAYRSYVAMSGVTDAAVVCVS
jgi:hypothetical protein